MMKWLMFLPLLLILVGWTPPETCDPSDREIWGNLSSPCKLEIPEIKAVEYRFRMEYPYCLEELIFHTPGVTSKPPNLEHLGLAFKNSPERHEGRVFIHRPVNDFSFRVEPDYIIFPAARKRS